MPKGHYPRKPAIRSNYPPRVAKYHKERAALLKAWEDGSGDDIVAAERALMQIVKDLGVARPLKVDSTERIREYNRIRYLAQKERKRLAEGCDVL